MSSDIHVWEVVGGADKGGVLVRSGKDMSAPKEDQRLATGALVKQLALDDKRLHYELLAGSGPRSGWVSVEISNKVLLVPTSRRVEARSEQLQAEDPIHLQNTASTPELAATSKARAAQEAAASATPPEEVPQVVVRVLPGAKDCQKPSRWTLEEVLSVSDTSPANPNEGDEPVVPARNPPQARGQPTRRFGASWRAGADYFFGSRRDLKPTFGYPGSIDEKPPFARFDIRDEVCMRVGGFKHGQVVLDCEGREFVVVGVKCVDCIPRLFFQPNGLGRPGAGSFPNASAKDLRAMLAPAARTAPRRLQEASAEDFDGIEDSDEEVVFLCRQCRLPLGTSLYVDNDGEGQWHGECMALLMLQKVQEEEEGRQQQEAVRKSKARALHGIGWRTECIPRNADHLRRLGYRRQPQSMVCLVLEDRDDAATTVKVSETSEPGASVNLEYLSLALRVRLCEGMEPAFSLDPRDASDDPETTLQVKRFEPAWLAGTSIGEVLFQADYHLKELSMGEYSQPVIGMKSCFDFSEEQGHSAEWRAREWFVVRDAQICMSDDSVLIPRVEMAVEAREQLNGADGIEDAPITRPDHPLVKYADQFSHNFDLIAERKSVVHQLRELAKASVLAKFLVEADVSLKEAWFHLAGEPRPVDCMEIPQLWNDRCHSQVCVKDGKIVEAQAGVGSKKHCIYGGVEFGLDRFSISRPSLASGAMLSRGASAAMSRVLGVTSVRQLGPSFPQQPLRAGIEAQAHLQGVDLDLSKFNLSTPIRKDAEGPAGSWGANARSPPEKSSTAGSAFWAHITHDSGPLLKEEDKSLLRDVFNPHLSDRRDEGEQFVPPESSFSHVQKLRRLVDEEKQERQRRKDHFLSKNFVMGNAGPLFPSSWTSSFEITRGRVLQRLAPGAHGLPEHCKVYKDSLALSVHDYNAKPPIFDRTAEDGTRFRIYKCGGLEVRTVQEIDGEEAVGAVLATSESSKALADSKQFWSDKAHDKVVKVTEYVERPGRSSATRQAALLDSNGTGLVEFRNSYITFETEGGDIILTEMLSNGTVAWEANPEALEDRNSCAKVVRSADCGSSGITVRDMDAYRAKESTGQASLSDRKHYAQVAYNWARGEPHLVDSGFSSRTAKTCAELQDTLGLSSLQMERYFSNFNVKTMQKQNRKGTAFGGVLRL